MNNTQKIHPSDLIDMGQYTDTGAIIIDLAYTKPNNLLFGEVIYHSEAKLWLHQDLARVVKHAAQDCFEKTGYRFVLYDGLRTTTAQAHMLTTQRVKNNPNWLIEPRLLSPPGGGGHPRGMAIDIALVDTNGALLDMGTPFDYLAEDSSPDHNPAHRDYIDLKDEHRENRMILDDAIRKASRDLDSTVVGLPQEWWDYRMPAEVYGQYAPLSDDDLPDHMKMVG